MAIEKQPFTRKLRLYKMVRGVRVPYIITIDENQVIIDQGFEDKKRPPISQTSRKSVDELMSIRLKKLDEQGIQYKVNGSSITVTGIPERVRKILTFFSKDSPCPNFPGCEKLREEYFKELEELESTDCTACDKSKLQNKYREHIDILAKGIDDL